MNGHYNTFIIRIWQEEPEGILRGYLRHTATQEEAYFASLEDLKQIIQKYLSSSVEDLTGQNNPIKLR
jgi:hypothetical protein